MKYLRLFETESQYETAKGEFEYPTVSYAEDIDIVHYMTLRDKYAREYLTFEALESGTFSFRFIGYDLNNNNYDLFSYSLDNGETWSHHNVGEEYYEGIDSGTINPDEENPALVITTPTVLAGSKLLLKGYGRYFTQYENFVDSTCDFNVSGNIYTLMRGEQLVDDEIIEDNIEDDENYDYSYMFYNCTHVVSAENLYLSKLTNKIKYTRMFYGCTKLTTAPKLPIVDTLVGGCYSDMFRGCTSLTTAPELPATTLAGSCYSGMFNGCTALTTAPELPATTLASDCYRDMFNGCTALTTAPELPATTLVTRCYYQMFYGCTSLTTAPELPATTLVNQCYYQMFYGCSKLNYIKAMFTTTPSTTYTKYWVNSVASTGTFVKNIAATWTTTGINAVPTRWTVETASA